MNELPANISAQSEQVNIILLLGIAIFGGTVGAKIFQKLRIPQVVGYVAIGLILGPFLKIIPPKAVQVFEPFNLFALGTIGFLVGGELKRQIFIRFGKQVPIVLLFEGVIAALMVGVFSFVVMLVCVGVNVSGRRWPPAKSKTGMSLGLSIMHWLLTGLIPVILNYCERLQIIKLALSAPVLSVACTEIYRSIERIKGVIEY